MDQKGQKWYVPKTDKNGMYPKRTQMVCTKGGQKWYVPKTDKNGKKCNGMPHKFLVCTSRFVCTFGFLYFSMGSRIQTLGGARACYISLCNATVVLHMRMS